MTAVNRSLYSRTTWGNEWEQSPRISSRSTRVCLRWNKRWWNCASSMDSFSCRQVRKAQQDKQDRKATRETPELDCQDVTVSTEQMDSKVRKGTAETKVIVEKRAIRESAALSVMI